ncbi:MFS transporter [Aestuariimicrobium sp. T2.26MG-19.2B]|uniref:MFS transporter n=1 Tax=Aestuariimicrobium sp. T2.26MG-19.2B TaxID=3040679 RepID=UPI002477570F|nr:MFS transporter [Aestuariimicrobium sp. T2.26MG-19.2B]CAI9407497.1 Multidrug resistance protein 3 [Aestuariimicrobium sp. T2.26MG-19.2B]
MAEQVSDQTRVGVVGDVEPPSLRALTVGVLTIVFSVAFQAIAVATAMPAAAAELGQLSLFAWAFSLFVIGMSLSTVLGGRACDAFGPVRPAVVGVALFGLGLTLAALAPTMVVLVSARFVQGLGGGLLNVSLMVIVARLWDEHRRAVLMTAFSFCWVLPAFVGPPVAAWLTHRWSWHHVFWSVIPVLVVASLLCVRPLARMREHLRPHPEQSAAVPIWAAVLVSLGLAGLQAGGQRLDWTGLVLAVVAAVAIAVSIRPLMAPGFLRLAPGIAAVSWARLLQAGTFFAAESFLPLTLVQLRGLTLFEAGLALTIGSIGWTLGSWFQSRSWFRVRRDQFIQLGTACHVVGVGLVAASVWFGWPLALIAIGWTVSGLGMGFSTASGTLAVMQLSAPAKLGRNTSSLQVSESMGNALLVGIAGTLFAGLRTNHLPATVFASVFAVMALVAVLALGASLRIGPVRNATAGVGPR